MASAPLHAHDPQRAEALQREIEARLADVPRHVAALRAAMAELGDFDAAYASDDPAVLNRAKAVERGVDHLYGAIVELAAKGLELAGLRMRADPVSPESDVATLARAGVIDDELQGRLGRLVELREMPAHERAAAEAGQVHEAAVLVAQDVEPFCAAVDRWAADGFRTEAVAGAAATHPVRMRVFDDLARSRGTVFFRVLLAIPHLIVFGVFALIALILLPILWIATLVRAAPPRGLAELYGRLIIYGVHVQAYVHLAAQPFPPFLGTGDPYPVDVEVPAPPRRQNRWTIAFRGILAVPALLLTATLGAGTPGATTSGTAADYSSAIGVMAAVGFLAWFACLARARMPRGFRDVLVYALGYVAQAYAYLFFLTDRYPNSDPALVPNAMLPEHPVGLGVGGDDLRRNRLTVFFRLPLAFPHLVWLTLWGVLVALAAIAAWLVSLFTARVPDGLHRFMAAFVRYSIHVYAFLTLAGSPFPGFTGAPGRYPVELRIADRETHGRWTIFFRWLLVFPALVVSSALGGAQFVAAVLAWFASLFTARMPLGLRNLIAYTLRYQGQVWAYALLLTPAYPYSGPGPAEALPPRERTLAQEAFG